MYMDPGAGSMLLQLLLGGAAGMAVVVRLCWHRIARLWRPDHQNPGDAEH
jgi:hypothetical protein